MNLSENFTLEEMTHSRYGIRTGTPNIPNEKQIENLKKLCVHVLQPLRDQLEKPITILSGYRSAEINKGIGGSLNSQHMQGQAADIKIAGLYPQEAFEKIIETGIEFDQLILEFQEWVHISYNHGLNRKQRLIAVRENGHTIYKTYPA